MDNHQDVTVQRFLEYTPAEREVFADYDHKGGDPKFKAEALSAAVNQVNQGQQQVANQVQQSQQFLQQVSDQVTLKDVCDLTNRQEFSTFHGYFGRNQSRL